MKVEQLYNACFPLVNLPDIAYLDGRLENVISVCIYFRYKSKMQHLILEWSWTKSCIYIVISGREESKETKNVKFKKIE